ncbi:hypothetical protein [Listeria fleischmannii]|uniref:hypothetical protein n=1 Tax=Listeria fleischmannii TaxID=1069827 RepID=UPI000254F9CC|nr:hypothetical protein [Listeria fleischmannii]EIA21408.1 hypothetical protein KKC_01422 [Listeria fleischmannii subsp. coloradonensis]MBC1420095.1 hypothetical protein [Listeria fleischmannii]STY35268.1 Uncharacterised protein [Listeria fleischmannii subsp. coloradonensis]
MDEYVKIKLSTYEYFRELERMKKLNATAESLEPAIKQKIYYSTGDNNGIVKTFVVDKIELEKVIKEIYGVSKAIIKWE